MKARPADSEETTGLARAPGDASADERRAVEETPIVLVAGNPNAGKTTLFNALTGARAKVANYPGVTVDRRSAHLPLPGGREVELVDVPGTYSLSARSPEEQVAVDAVLGHGTTAPSAIVVVVDATALGRNLYLAQQVIETGTPVVVAMSMYDEATAAGIQIDVARLGHLVGAEVVPVVASKRHGLPELAAAIARAIAKEHIDPPRIPFGDALEADLAELEGIVASSFEGSTSAKRRSWATWALLSLGGDELVGIPPALREAVVRIRERAEAAERDVDVELIGARYAQIDRITSDVLKEGSRDHRRWTEQIDAVLTHPVLGFVVFGVVMLIVFEALFSWSEPAIGLVEQAIAWAQRGTAGVLPEGPLRGLVVDGVIAGVGNVVVFVPQIALLFLFIGVLEDSGYLARVAFVIDRLMASVGLHGRAFVPLLSGFACAVPAVMATRTIESRRDRLVTMLALPLMSCSARLPVYVLVTATVFAANGRVLGVVSTGAAVLLAMYALSIVATLTSAAVLRRTVLKGPRPPLVLELPPYRMPLLRNLLASTWQRVKTFLVDAGTIILALTIILWALLAYPKSDDVTARYDAERAQASQVADTAEREARLSELEAQEAGEQLRYSVAGRLGRAIEPVLEPLGFDWRLGIGILGAFAAREVFVSTLGIVFGIGETDEESEPLRAVLREARWPDGAPLMTPLVGVGLMVFFVLACQCMSTIAVVRRESGGWKWPLLMLGYMTALAYVAALLVHQAGRALGWG